MTKISRQIIEVGESVNGQTQTVTAFKFVGEQPGPSVYIQANLHGAEVQGNAVIYHLLNRLETLNIRGQITLVPLANPLGINLKSGEYTNGRFDPVTGANWNRMYFHDLDFLPQFVAEHMDASDEQIRRNFKAALLQNLDKALNDPLGLKSGQHICFALQKMATEADYVLDLHTGPISSKHLYVAEYSKSAASYFNIPHVLLIPNQYDGALDEACFVPWWTLTEAFAEKGRLLATLQEAYTLELGSQEQINLQQAQADADSVMSYLSYKNVFVDQQFEPLKMTRYACYLKDYKTVYAPRGGLVEYHGKLGQILPAGETLAQILNVQRFGQSDALTTLTLPDTVLPILHHASASVWQGAELYKVFYEYFELY